MTSLITLALNFQQKKERSIMKCLLLGLIFFGIPSYASFSSAKTTPTKSAQPRAIFHPDFNPAQPVYSTILGPDTMDVASISDTSTTFGSTSPRDSEDFEHVEATGAQSSTTPTRRIPARGVRTNDNDEFVALDQQGVPANQYTQENISRLSDSVDLSLSTITLEARKNRDLTPEQLQSIAIQLIKQKEKVLKKRRGLSRRRSAADEAAAKANHDLQDAQKKHDEALAKQEELKDLENQEKEVQKRIYDAMGLLYSTIRNSPDITAEIKEEWEEAKKPGGKLSFLEAAFNGCLLL